MSHYDEKKYASHEKDSVHAPPEYDGEESYAVKHHELVRQLKSRHIAMIRFVCYLLSSLRALLTQSHYSIGGVIGTGMSLSFVFPFFADPPF